MNNNIKLIAQNFDIYEGDGLHPEARTGAVSIKHLLNAGAQGVILGHPEAGDSDMVVNKKIKSIINNKDINFFSDGFILIVVVGDTWEEFENSSYEQVGEIIYEKCKIIFNGIPEEALKNLIIAYDPKWGSRGSGQKDVPPPEPELISICILKAKQFIKETYINIDPSYIYGGSSTPERTLEILKDENKNGLLLGSACNTVEKTLNILSSMEEAKGNKKKVVVCNFKAFIPGDAYEKYIEELNKLPDDYNIYLAPAYTDIRLVYKLMRGT